MIRNKNLVIVLISCLIIILFGLGIGYAAMQTSLTLTVNKIVQQAQSWGIGFVTGTINGVAGSGSSSSIDCGSVTATATTISGISADLKQVNDKCTYTFTIKNSGTIGGKITGITITSPSGITCTKSGSTMTCGDITYKLTYNTSDGTAVAVNNTIAGGVSKTVVLTIQYTGSSVTNTQFTQSGFMYTLAFGQN